MKSISIKMILLLATLALVNCGGGSSGGSTNNGTAGGVTVVPNTGTVTVVTDLYSIVSIGSTGTNFKTVDAQGKAVFTGLTPGAVDVHIFSADGYSATSYYGVNSNIINDSSGAPSVTTGSFIDTYVSIVNADPYGQRFELRTSTVNYRGFVFGNQLVFSISSPAGTVITGELIISQGKAQSSAGNILIGGAAESISLGQQTFTTVASPTFSAVSNLVVDFSVSPTPPVLATVNPFVLPTGHTIEFFYIGNVSIDTYTQAAVFPDTIRSATSGNLGWNILSQSVSQSWFQFASFSAGATITPKVTFTAFPTLINQAGNTITWTNGIRSSTVSYNLVSVDGALTPHNWTFFVQSNVSSLVLPTVPSGVVGPLIVGNTYDIRVGNAAAGNLSSLEQVFRLPANQPFQGVVEGVFSTASYVR